MQLPSFLVVGAAKCGTTSLFHYLNSHPEIYIPERKEGRFFSQMPGNFKGPGARYQNDVIRTFGEYSALYENTPETAIAGDISNDYLYFYEKSIPAIKEYLGDETKIIILLRNPVDRAYSHYMQHFKDGYEKVSFRETLANEQRREKKHWSWTFLYKKPGLYSEQVKAFLESFENTRVYIFREFWFENKEESLIDCFNFIGTEPPAVIENYKSNVSGYPKSWLIQNFFNRLGPFNRTVSPTLEKLIGRKRTVQLRHYIKNKNLKKIKLDKTVRHELFKYFEPDIMELSELLGRDMTKIWKN